MKRFITILFSVLFTQYMFSIGHMRFQNISFDEPLDSIIKMLEYKGFMLTEYYDDGSMAKMSGTFCSEQCELYIVSSFDSKIVYKISIFIKSDRYWMDIAMKYNSYLNFYYRKYGDPYIAYYTIDSPFKKNDGDELLALYAGKLHCHTIWRFEEGAIVVSIEHTGEISITYEDDKNTDDKNKDDIEFINNEI